MVIWTTLGTFSFGDIDYDGDGTKEPGLFSRVRPKENNYQIQVPKEMVLFGAQGEVQKFIANFRHKYPDASNDQIREAVEAQVPNWRDGGEDRTGTHYGYWLMVIAGVGIFCGCIGKSAQFPLHVWLPDAMEGPTPVSALVHSATMVAAGVYLTGRFYPVFVPEALFVIAIVGCITLFLAATIAITATDIKRVLAYSTVSQLGYMMMALGVGGWLAGMMHLVTHAFFKSLLFMGSGSVIHAVHTNEMTEMGGLRKKMPWTAYTMLVGCLAIAGAGIPFIIGMLSGSGYMGLGLSGFYSKDAILEQAFSFMWQPTNGAWGGVFFFAAAGGAAVTAFYMFRLWYMTFSGKPRDQHRYDHAHESPKVMYVPLVILAFFAITVAWRPFDLSLYKLLDRSQPVGTLTSTSGKLLEMNWPNEHDAHEPDIVIPVSLIAIGTALSGFLLATVMYGLGYLSPADVRRQFQPIYRLLINKWWFDELYDFVFVRPSHVIANCFAGIDKKWIDGLIDGLAKWTVAFAVFWDRIPDRIIVDGTVNVVGRWMYSLGLALRVIQTGKLRQYIVFIVIGAIGLFVLISFFWAPGAVQAH
jgi:NADH-quinone oxidoreductase subunit L